MRQAGRYLPEYRELRSRTHTFLDFCYNPVLASEATVQPINRFGFDAAILFCDILVIPDALGQQVSFESGEGPRLTPIDQPEKLAMLKQGIDFEKLSPVFETIDRARSKLGGKTPLIGFCGAPWTVASYMIAGRGTPDQAPARIFAYKYPNEFSYIIDILVKSSAEYLIRQFKAGVDAVQIFDSWSGVLPVLEFEKWCLRPLERIIDLVIDAIPDAPIIGFPRGAGTHLEKIVQISALKCIGVDTAADPDWVAKMIQNKKTVQGNLDPLALLVGGAGMIKAAEKIMESFKEGPYIFNLGHGILPQTPIENVENLLKFIRNR